MWLRRGDPPRIPYSLRQGSAASAATGLPGRGAAAAPSPTSRDKRGGVHIARFRCIYTTTRVATREADDHRAEKNDSKTSDACSRHLLVSSSMAGSMISRTMEDNFVTASTLYVISDPQWVTRSSLTEKSIQHLS
jgi:hypothetical protein